MAKALTINGLRVILLKRNDKYSDIIDTGLKQNATAVPALSTITHSDTVIHGKANAIQAKVIKLKSKPPTATKADVMILVNDMVDAYNQNCGEAQSIARSEAKAAGDVNVGIKVLEDGGFNHNQPSSTPENTFSVTADGPSAAKIDTKAPARGTTYIREYGRCTAENVVPEKDDLEEWMIGHESAARAQGMKSKSWYAFREAFILPISRRSDSAPTVPEVEKKATPALINKAGRRTFIAGGESNYNFGPWIWVFIL